MKEGIGNWTSSRGFHVSQAALAKAEVFTMLLLFSHGPDSFHSTECSYNTISVLKKSLTQAGAANQNGSRDRSRSNIRRLRSFAFNILSPRFSIGLKGCIVVYIHTGYHTWLWPRQGVVPFSSTADPLPLLLRRTVSSPAPGLLTPSRRDLGRRSRHARSRARSNVVALPELRRGQSSCNGPRKALFLRSWGLGLIEVILHAVVGWVQEANGFRG
jgi:hypothetical protein